MKKTLIVGFWLLVTALAHAGERVGLWPEGKIPNFQPQQIAATTQEVKAPGFKAAEHAMPYLDWYEAPAEKNGGMHVAHFRRRLSELLRWGVD